MSLKRVVISLVCAALLAGGPSASSAAAKNTADLVRFPFPQDDGTLTPYTFDLGYPLVTLIYDTLMWRDANGTPQPWLATSMDTANDGRQVTLHLAPNVQWQDGQPLTSSDVAFTFDYVAKNPHPWFTPELAAVDNVATPDPATVVINLNSASPGFADQPLSDLPILPKHLWENLPEGATEPPGMAVGSGPYRLASYDAKDGYRFTANDNYFKGAPAVKEIRVPIMGNVRQTVQYLQDGAIDMVPAALDDNTTKTLRQHGAKSVTGPSYGGIDLVFNTRHAPFDQAAARHAVAIALDIPLIARRVDNSTPATTGFIHPDSPWSPKDPLAQFDQSAARATLGPMALPAFRITAPESDPTLVQTAHEVAAALQDVGLQATVDSLNHDDYTSALGDGSTENFDVAVWRAPPFASYDPDFLRRFFGSNPDDARLNFSGYNSAAFDDLANKIATTQDATGRKAAVSDALKLLTADAPMVPLMFPTASYVFRPGVFDGWLFVKGTGILDKQSFLAHGPPPSSTTAASSPAGATAAQAAPATPVNSGGGGLPYGLIGLVFFLAAGSLVGVAVLRRRR